MKRYDLHIHSKYSACSNLRLKTILKIAKKRKLDGIAVTDHDTMKGNILIRKLNKDKDFDIIPGEEIMTDNGEILAYYIQEEIKPGIFEDVIDKIREQNGLASIAHPYAIIRKIKLKRKITKRIDAIEGFNGRNIIPLSNKKACLLAKKLKVGITGGSDAHFFFEIGNGVTMFNGNLRNAILKRKTSIKGTLIGGMIGLPMSVVLRDVIRNIMRRKQ